MRLEIKNPALFITKLEQISKFLSYAMVSFYKDKISVSGMNSDNILLVSLELNEEALAGYKFAKTADYAFNISAFLNAVNDATSLKFEFKAGKLTITTDTGKAIIPTIKLEHSEEQNELEFDTSFDISHYLPLFNECMIKAKGIFPIQLEGRIGEGMRMKVVVSPTKYATQLFPHETSLNIKTLKN